ncbi:MAG: hypothetical protein IJW06_05710 [Clostridia bacterium]|nr:hypothetical protein [Clostridia bacterium]
MSLEKRVCFLYCTLIVVVSLLLARLYNLSKPETNKALSVLDGQYTGKLEVCERSGFVYDRNGFLLSHNNVGKIALVNPAECEDVLLCAEALSSYALVGSGSQFYEKIMDGVPFTVTLGKDDMKNVPSGISLFDAYEENNSIAKHFLGYTNADGKGMSGLRGAYSDFLVEELHSVVSARFDTNAKRESLSSFDIDTQGYLSDDGVVTTVDKNLQVFVDGICRDIPSGAVVVADCKTGQILAMSSYPGYDKEEIAELLDSDKGELLNRAVMSFAPGSVFKIIVAMAALEENGELFDYKYICNGKIQVGEGVFHCHKHSGHGEIDMTEAFSESCNTYFISLGQIIGLEKILEMLKRLELDTGTGADFVKEGINFFPDKDNSSSGYLANISFGQGDLCLSPLDMTRCTIAAVSGYLPELSTVMGEIRDGEFEPCEKEKTKRILDEKVCEKILTMMEKCVESGTGKGARTEKIKLGGKTATAQTGRFNGDGVEYVHKWFCGVYPGEKNYISVCVLFDSVTDENLSPAVIFSKICSFLHEKRF